MLGAQASDTITAPTRAQVLAKNINRYVPVVNGIVSYAMLTQKSVNRGYNKKLIEYCNVFLKGSDF